MCLYSQNKEPKIANKDIICYKVVGFIPKYNLLYTPFQGTPFNPNEDGVIEIDEDNEDYIISKSVYENENRYVIGPGYIHTYRLKKDVCYCSRPVYYRYSPYRCPVYKVYKCVIPKGTEYYKGVEGGEGMECYASRLIKIVREI